MHCNLRLPEWCQPFPALITTPCQVWSCLTYPLPYYSVFAADTLLYPVTLTSNFEHLQHIACEVVKLCTKFERNQVIRGGSYCDFSVWPYDLEHCVTCCARLWDNFHQVWPAITYPCPNYSILMLISYVTLWPWPLTSWSWVSCV